MKRRALILIEGNSTGNGLAFVRAARNLDLVPIMLVRDPRFYKFVATERIKTVIINTANINAVIKACERLKSSYEIAGVTCSSESYYRTVAIVCRHFELPGPDPEAVERCLDKFRQREQMTRANIPMPAYRVANSAADSARYAAEIGYPVVVKPTYGNGSTGVRLCKNHNEVIDHTTLILMGEHGMPARSAVLVEEFAVGQYYSCDLFEGEALIVYVADFGELPSFAMRNMTVPAALSDIERDSIAVVAQNSAKALDLIWGPVNVEMRVTKHGPVIIEVNPRIVGAPGPKLIQLACGVDLIAETIKLFTGQKADISQSCSRFSAGRYVMPESAGILDWVGDQEQARAVPGIYTIELKALSGTPIMLRGDWQDIIAHVIAVSPDAKKASAAVQQAVELMEWTMLPLQD